MRIKTDKIKIFFLKFPRVLAGRSFLTFLGIVLLTLVIGGSVFYKYEYLTEKTEPRIPTTSFKFDENVYKDMLVEWEKREKKFSEADFKNYPDLFRAVTPATSSVSTVRLTE